MIFVPKHTTMKKLFVLLLIIYTQHTYSQCTDSFFAFKEGASFEQTSFDKKDKPLGRTVSTVTSTTNNEALVSNKIYDHKDKLLTEATYKVLCTGNSIQYDFESFVPSETFSQYGSAEISVEGDIISIPNNLSIGQTLEDGKGIITIDMSSMKMNMAMLLNNRKVELKEKLTTKAGTFECYKITQSTSVTMDMMGMKRTTETSSASWFTKGVGLVRTENYDKKGNLTGYSLLTSFQAD